MSVYLGESGCVEIQRTAVGSGFISGTLEIADVDQNAKRFSFDFPVGALITGDRIEIATQDKSNLELVKDHDYPDGRWYCHVDQTGGLRLYGTFAEAVNGRYDPAVELVTPTKAQLIFVRNRDDDFNPLAQIQQYEITTTREAVDLTVLGDSFREQYANGLISGQGTIRCIWEYLYSGCDIDVTYGQELPNYFAQLVLRLEQGSLFKGRFYLHEQLNQAVWYTADCVVTNVGFAFSPGAIVQTSIEFVTTGPIQLLIGQLPTYILQEDRGDILLEDGGRLEQEEPQP
jgi:hypothetical protein